MKQPPPRQPQEPPKRQRVLGQQQWKQHLPPYQLALYNQLSQASPGQFKRPAFNNFPPPKRRSGLWQWYTSRTKKVKLSIGCGMILAVLLFFSCIGTAVRSVNLATQSTPSPTPPAHSALGTSSIHRHRHFARISLASRIFSRDMDMWLSVKTATIPNQGEFKVHVLLTEV